MSWILNVAGILSLAISVLGTCDPDKFDLNGQQCCSKCSLGFGVTGNCDVGNDTVCEKCVSGKTFSPNISHDEPCLSCSTCLKHAHVKSVCNEMHDTVCECDADYYLSEDQTKCELCDLCPGGWQAARPCNRHQNTICEQCPNGTYSNVLSATAGCTICTWCTENQRLLQTCTGTQDTICLTIPTYAPGDGNIWDRNNNPIQKQHSHDEKEIDIIPLYCAILGAVVVGLLGYVILVHYRRMKEKRLIREPHDDVEYSKASGADSGIYVEVEHQHKLTSCAILACSTRIRDLPQAKKRELERCFTLSKDSSEWKALAQQLGFNARKVSSFEMRSKRDSVSPLRHMIQEWSKNDTATVGVLIHALKNIGRQDILRNLQITDPCELQPLNPAQQHIL